MPKMLNCSIEDKGGNRCVPSHVHVTNDAFAVLNSTDGFPPKLYSEDAFYSLLPF
uniref:Uncharacterized protein n=1 Tax=Rhizophora mucronata TaxID=61149 RepID=A0A2P2M392_RHIMU